MVEKSSRLIGLKRCGFNARHQRSVKMRDFEQCAILSRQNLPTPPLKESFCKNGGCWGQRRAVRLNEKHSQLNTP